MKFKSFHWLSHHGLWAIIPYACARRRPVQPEVYLHILTFRLLTNIEAVLAVMNITELVVEIWPENNLGPYGIWTHGRR